MYKLPRIRINVIIIKDDKLLLVKHSKQNKDYWLLPGGGLEYGESIYECAKREVLEETGLIVSIDKFWAINESIAPDKSRHIINIYLLAKIVDGNLKIGDKSIKDIKFIDFNELDNLTLYPPIKDKLIQLKNSNFELNGLLSYLGNIWQD